MELAKIGDNTTTTVDDRLTTVITRMKADGYLEVSEELDPLKVVQEDGSWAVSPELQRVEAKTARDTALQANTYTLGDGSVYQVRPQDLGNLQLAIARGVDKKWTMANNDIRLTTIAELTEIMSSGIDQGEVIWDAFHTAVEGL